MGPEGSSYIHSYFRGIGRAHEGTMFLQTSCFEELYIKYKSLHRKSFDRNSFAADLTNFSILRLALEHLGASPTFLVTSHAYD